MHLEASFDIDQTSDQLAWHFVRYDGEGNPIHGKEAGVINFTVNEKFYIDITAGSDNPIAGVKIVDCVLISKPFMYICGPDVATEYAPPSPFAPKLLGAIVGASIALPAAEFEEVTVPPVRKYHRAKYHWNNHLTVGGFQGRWELSFVLTVQIARPNGRQELRVFSFDPESDVSNGVIDSPADVSSATLLPESDVNNGTI